MSLTPSEERPAEFVQSLERGQRLTIRGAKLDNSPIMRQRGRWLSQGLLQQLGQAELAGPGNRDLGHIAEFFGKLRELGDAPQDVPHVDAEHLAIFECIEGGPFFVPRGGLGQSPGQLGFQFVP